ncbi:putative DNA-binding transcriptional regulator AlpA [Kribbella aluminosa]|uniref:DNA-binding transcriptional regulator AlpA n=1 Tax=Kribbella aluminosa TaxID=416017 RepID=A0ABS4UYR8_9ACTN|nr:helix-turn-helix domain-containing protein [Kribbella aluminosa]MBP2356810.1 putative DNA-binding transcriptional regulator AlpA [Kribbella aluminosa]
MADRFMTTAEVAEVCRTPAETVRFWRHVNKGPKSFKVGRRVLYAVEDVEAWLAEARQAASGPDAA